MNHFMDYVCRGIVRSEDAIRCLNKRTIKLAKCNSQLSTAVICMGIAGMLTAAMLAEHDKEIKALSAQVSFLRHELAANADVADTTEGETQQEGA